MSKSLIPFSYPALLIRKKAWDFSLVSFMAEAGDLKTWTGVYRKDINQKGYQRIFNAEHSNQIKRFLQDHKNVIPNSIVIAFNDQLEVDGVTAHGAMFKAHDIFHPVDEAGREDEETEISTGVLQVRVHPECLTRRSEDNEVALSSYRSAYVIDGQHRIYGGNSAGGNIYLTC